MRRRLGATLHWRCHPLGKLQRLCDGSGCRVGRKIKAADRWTVSGFSLIIWRMCLVRGTKNTHKKERQRLKPQRRVQTLCFAFEAGVFLSFSSSIFSFFHSKLSAGIKGSGRRGHWVFYLRYLLVCWLPAGRDRSPL